MGYNDTFQFYGYTGDDGITYAIKMSAADAQANAVHTVVPAPPTTPAWPWLAKDLRHVIGFDGTGNKRGRLVITTNTDPLYVAGGTWNNFNTGASYGVTSAIGEKRPSNHVK
jgi:hypothetical protein